MRLANMIQGTWDFSDSILPALHSFPGLDIPSDNP
jgi:hypothetical protein